MVTRTKTNKPSTLLILHTWLLFCMHKNGILFKIFWHRRVRRKSLYRRKSQVFLNTKINSLSEAELSTLLSLLSFAEHCSLTPMVCPTGDLIKTRYYQIINSHYQFRQFSRDWIIHHFQHFWRWEHQQGGVQILLWTMDKEGKYSWIYSI